MIYLLLIFLLGFLPPIQTAANSRLRQSVSTPLVASLVSFFIGMVFLILATLIQKGTITFSPECFHELPWWAWLGGVCGLYALTVNLLIYPKIGAVQTALMPMLGQIGMGMLIDHFGWFQSNVYSFTILRLGALCLILAGVCMVVMRKKSPDEKNNKLMWQLIGISGGAIFAMQPPMNSMVAFHLHSAVHAALITFLSATFILLLLVLLMPAERVNIPKIFSLERPWWSWLGGIIGGVFVTGFAFFADKTGIGVLLVTSICGMLACSLLIDKYGMLGATPKVIRPIQYIGLICVVVGIMVLRLN